MKSRWIVIAIAFTATLAACGSDEVEGSELTPGAASANARCATCGMRVAPDSGWRAGAEDGLSFDAPKCLFRYRHREGEVSGAWVIEYYTQQRRPAREMRYVLGSDLESPMGRDLVPVEGRAAAERLMADHHGQRVLAFDEVSEDIVETLFRPRP